MSFKIYKGKGAAQFSRIPPKFATGEDGRSYRWVSKDGAVLLEAAPAIGKRPDGLPEYDWQQKISFAISVADICQIVDPVTMNSNGKVELFHKTSSGTKILEITQGTGKYTGTYQMILKFNNNGNRSQVFIPLTGGEYQVLLRLLVSSVAYLLGWESR